MQLEKKCNISTVSIATLALASVMIGISVYGCRKEKPQKEDTSISVFLGDKLCKNTKIAFVSNRDGNCEIYIMNADGSDMIRLTNRPAPDTYPCWSPDGRRIVFESKRDGDSEIYVMNADGTEQIKLTNNPRVDGYPSWSPEGKKIAFMSYRNGNDEICVMNADGSERRNISNNPADDFEPSWSPFLAPENWNKRE